MRLRQLTGLEQNKLREEYDDLQKALEGWLSQEGDVNDSEVNDPAVAAKAATATEDVSSAFDDLFNS